MDLIVIIGVGLFIVVAFEWVSSFLKGEDFYRTPLANSLDLRPPESRYEHDQFVVILKSWHNDVFTIASAIGAQRLQVRYEVSREDKTLGSFSEFIIVRSDDAASYEGYLKSYLNTYTEFSSATGRVFYECTDEEMTKAIKSALMFKHNEIFTVH